MNTTSEHKGKQQYSSELKRLEKADILPEQKDTILRFHAHLRAKQNSDDRVVKLSWQLRKIAGFLKKPFEEATK